MTRFHRLPRELREDLAAASLDPDDVLDHVFRALQEDLPGDDDVDTTSVATIPEDATGVENWRKIFPFPFTREYIAGVAIFERRVIDIADAQEGSSNFSTGRQNFLKSGYRAVTKVPMIRGDSAIGVLSVARPAPGPLSDKQLAILKHSQIRQ